MREIPIYPTLGLLQTVSTPSQEGNQEVDIRAGAQMRLLAYPDTQDDDVLLDAVGRLVDLLFGQLGQSRREWTSHFGGSYAVFDRPDSMIVGQFTYFSPDLALWVGHNLI